ncbi:probable calcium-binding protein CML22 [Vigna radiata var. radiata]|uniref:Probable calcium-binding protein CML22 n=1 Tax=Vigna radiata var. radiata TaxID=3916 RepID=A0A1S3VXJ4_VIGRR|nr:probable calcium-binding protein CML22 [Vigna radiata var. radiata]XP_014523096.1 probable calcium-binding protein CML22 [Vigna radiata var. radiata]XP_014523097.1 probable calcium-binding protein CML22 [Vigna radiata var. radiata]XP_014523098.1 probable calcium-binding protein CML22 [Vigna radiata var. radiata]XP_014523099.1 probable calcium-binding protein CML22 [Vigna radiata var. radiata]XP_022632310.1 probable calcium-binding protein CML22 [Vigna radiata var. radiata]XP_022632311.1 pr
MGVIMSCIGKSSKNMSLDDKIERKIVEMRRYKFGQSKLKSVDSIVMMFPMFKERLKTLRGMFEQYDEDSNGSIEPNELKKFLEHLQLHLKEQEIENLFEYCDLDGSKGIQFNEFIVLLCLIHLLAEPSSSVNSSKAGLEQVGEIFNTIVEAFVFFDQNGDGKLNKKDMIRTLNETNPRERSPARISKHRFQEMDWDKNGQVTFREFLFGFINWVGIEADE